MMVLNNRYIKQIVFSANGTIRLVLIRLAKNRMWDKEFSFPLTMTYGDSDIVKKIRKQIAKMTKK